jgi:hypothetical protein
MSPLVLSTMANNSLCSAAGTLNFAIVSSKSLQKTAHSLSVIFKVLMRFAHGAATVVLGPTCGPTDHLGHLVFEPRRADAVMRLVNGSVRIQDWGVHNPIDEVVNYGSNRVDATESLVERGLAGC